MSQGASKLARSMVMMTAGGAHDDVMEIVRLHQLKTVHFDQLAVPPEEEASRQRIIQLIKPTN